MMVTRDDIGRSVFLNRKSGKVLNIIEISKVKINGEWTDVVHYRERGSIETYGRTVDNFSSCMDRVSG